MQHMGSQTVTSASRVKGILYRVREASKSSGRMLLLCSRMPLYRGFNLHTVQHLREPARGRWQIERAISVLGSQSFRVGVWVSKKSWPFNSCGSALRSSRTKGTNITMARSTLSAQRTVESEVATLMQSTSLYQNKGTSPLRIRISHQNCSDRSSSSRSKRHGRRLKLLPDLPSRALHFRVPRT